MASTKGEKKMNKSRRKILASAVELIEHAIKKLDFVKEDEEFAYEMLPENFQISIRGEIIQENAEALGDAIEQLNDVINCVKYL